jgi:hypothetical protein
MPHHDERPPNVLARGPAKPADIENARRGTVEARATEHSNAQQAIGEIEAACETIRDDLGELKRIVRERQ